MDHNYDDNDNNPGIPEEMINPFAKGKNDIPLRPSALRSSDAPEDNRYTVVESSNFEAFGQEAEDFAGNENIYDTNNEQDKIAGEFKIIFIGNFNVGKTSIIQRFIYNKFAKSDVSVGQEKCSKFLRLDQNTVVKLELFDTMGQERFGSLQKQLYKDALGVIAVYDITDRESLEKLENWIKIARDTSPPDIVLTIAANKMDLNSMRKIPTTEGNSFAQSHGASFFEVSAKEGNNVDLLFEDLANKIITKQKEIKEEDKVIRRAGRNSVGLEDAKKKDEKKSGCC